MCGANAKRLLGRFTDGKPETFTATARWRKPDRNLEHPSTISGADSWSVRAQGGSERWSEVEEGRVEGSGAVPGERIGGVRGAQRSG
jgi:hypothetical protein